MNDLVQLVEKRNASQKCWKCENWFLLLLFRANSFGLKKKNSRVFCTFSWTKTLRLENWNVKEIAHAAFNLYTIIHTYKHIHTVIVQLVFRSLQIGQFRRYLLVHSSGRCIAYASIHTIEREYEWVYIQNAVVIFVSFIFILCLHRSLSLAYIGRSTEITKLFETIAPHTFAC